jgi:hypothetical protein
VREKERETIDLSKVCVYMAGVSVSMKDKTRILRRDGNVCVIERERKTEKERAREKEREREE